MKKTKQLNAYLKHDIIKALLFMKLTIALLLISFVQVSANGLSQSITLKLNNAELKKALFTIEKKANCRFLYNDDAVSTVSAKVNIDVENTPVTDVLNKIFVGTNLTYRLLDNHLIVLSAKDNSIQDLRVKGKVVNASGDGVPAATIRVKGTNVVTSADVNGNFAITAPDNGVLVISSVGYNDQEIIIRGRTEIAVTLIASEKKLDEVVVIGYGTASKRDLTGSIVKVAGKDVADKPNTNPIASLQSKVSGLYVVNNGTPGAAPDIRIRGTISIGQVHPLYIVDGIFQDNIDYLNPNDIESIEILKDPSSLAIFGVKGATGVIAITTKKAKAGQLVVNFNTTYGFKQLVDKIKMANASQFNTLFQEENANNGVATPDYSLLTANTDWINAVTKTGNFNSDNLTLSTATDKNRFNLGVGYVYDEGIVKHEQLQKMLLNISDEIRLTKSIKLGFNYNFERINHPYDVTNTGANVLDQARKIMPQISAGTKVFTVNDPYTGLLVKQSLYSQLDEALQNSGVDNTLMDLENNWDKTINIEYRHVGSFYVDVNFLKNFNFHASWYGDLSNEDKRQYTPLYYGYLPQYNSSSPADYATLVSAQTKLQENNEDWKKYQQDYLVNYKKSFGDHNLTATGGFTTYYYGDFGRQVLVKQGTTPADLPIPNDKRFWYVNSGPWGYVDPTNTTSSQNEYTTVSELFRALYNYKGKYYLNASFRNDASSRIPVKNRNQQFWAAGAAWEISKESFMQNIKQINFLKLKASYGLLGNQSASKLDGTPLNYPAYPYLNTGGSNGAVFGTYFYNAPQPAYIANPNLKWETVNAGEVGFELSAFTNRLHVEFNYYDKTTKNLMTYVSRTGLPDELINGGKIHNWGEEIMATWNQNINKDLSVSVAGNITFQQNKVVSLSSELPTGFLSRGFANNNSAEARSVPGHPIGSFYGYIVDGLYQTYADVLASPIASSIGSYGPGDFKFKDIAGPTSNKPDGVVDANDRTFIGNPNPKFIYGGSLGVNYKQFSLSVDLGGVYGNDIFRVWGSLESPYQRVNYPEFKMNRWHGAGTSNWDPIISQGHRFNYNGSTYNIEDGSYFRIRNLQLAYTFDSKLLSKANIKSLRVFGNVQNPKTWKHNKGYTPEYGGDATAFGFDNGGGAIPMITTFGLNVTF